MTLFKWSTTASSNSTVDDTINARENQAPSTVNDAMRGIMAAVAKWRNDLSGNLVTGGSSTIYTLTTNQVYTTLTDGIAVRARMNATSGATPTLNVDGLGAKAIASVYGTAVPTGALLSGGVYDFVYDSTDDKWIVTGINSLAGSTGTLPVANGGTGSTTAAAAATALGLGTGDSPQFTAVNIGDAADTTVSRASAGQIAVEGVQVVTLSNSVTLTNKTLTSPTINAPSISGGTISSPTLTTPALGTPSSGTLSSCTSLPIDGGTTGTLPVARGGTGVTGSTGSGSNVLQFGPTLNSPALVTPNIGTPSAGTLSACSGLPIDGGTTGTLPVARGGTGVTASTGSGSNVLSTSPTLSSPTLSTPVLGTPSSGTLSSCTGLPIDGGTTGTLTVARGGTGATDAGTARTNLGLGTMATQAASAVAITGGTITGLSTAVSGTVATTTGGTDVEQTGIPSWARVLIVSFSGVSGTGGNDIVIQLGTTSAYATSGYEAGHQIGTSGATTSGGFNIRNSAAGDVFYGSLILVKHTGNTWVGSGHARRGAGVVSIAGSIALADTLTRVRLNITADTFDAMSFNVTYL